MAASKQRPGYWLTRFWFLRGLGFVYFIGFLIAINQWKPLLGSDGLIPMPLLLAQARQALGWRAILAVPTLFWLHPSDAFVMACAWIGLIGSAAVLAGVTNAGLMILLWALYASLVHAGQLFYGYGWEMMMIEAGFLAIFLCPFSDWRPFPKKDPPPAVVIWMLRWMLFRLMFGAGMIKLRGDSCWRDLTCLYYHFETQPLPNPLSWYFHNLPHQALRLGVVFNHFAEIGAPWLAFGPRLYRWTGGLVMIAFQIVLILSGNLSFLNYLTIVIALSCFDDRLFARFFPFNNPISAALGWDSSQPGESGGSRPVSLDMRKLTFRTGMLYALCALVGVLSVRPALNLFSTNQIMNGSFDPIGLVNSYGAFGSVGKERLQLALEGTNDSEPTDSAQWREYAFKCSPGDVRRRPCVISAYQERLDWQIWFAAMESPEQNAWLFNLVVKLLQGNRGTIGLFGGDPFPDAPPKFIRAILYRYHFTHPSDHSKDWWTRERVGVYLPPLSLDTPHLMELLRSSGLTP